MTFDPKAGFRSEVTLPDVPLTWRTNLTDDEIREVYQILLARRFFIREPEIKKPNIETGQGLTVGLGETTDLEYKGRMCLISVVGERVVASCRTLEEWNQVYDQSVLKERDNPAS